MTRVSKIGLAALAATAVIAGSAVTASAAPASARATRDQANAASIRSQHPDGSSVTVPLKLSPGTHTMSLTTSTLTTSAGYGGSKYVSIRVGKNDCGGYKGTVYWGLDMGNIPAVELTGTLWDNCNYYTPNTTVYLYLSWYPVIGRYQSYYFASVSGAKNTEDIGNPGTETFSQVTDLKADTCLKWDNGWGCGPSELVYQG